MLAVTTIKDNDMEVISESHYVVDAQRDLETHLFHTATDQYSDEVIKWFTTDPSKPFDIKNGGDTERWEWTGDPR